MLSQVVFDLDKIINKIRNIRNNTMSLWIKFCKTQIVPVCTLSITSLVGSGREPGDSPTLPPSWTEEKHNTITTYMAHAIMVSMHVHILYSCHLRNIPLKLPITSYYGSFPCRCICYSTWPLF